MVAYRFCRSDDIPLLVAAHNRCWRPHHPGEPELDERAFKRWVRDIQLWTSSCMVAVAGGETVGVLLGCKRDDATLVWRLAVHPDHRRRGHGRHLLTSLSSKLAILGPPRLVVELPGDRPDLAAFFAACGYQPGAELVTYRLCAPPPAPPPLPVIPFTVDDLLANDVFDATIERAWRRGLPALVALRRELVGYAVASFEGIEAYLLGRPGGAGGPAEAVAFGTTDPNRQAEHLAALLAAWVAGHGPGLELPQVTEAEIAPNVLLHYGLESTSAWRRWTAQPRPA